MERCPKCGGCLALAYDVGLRELKCLNCGKRLVVRPARARLSSREQEARVQARRRAYMARYFQRPDVQARRRAYSQRPDVQARRRAYMARYVQRPDVQARRRAYMRNYMRAYYQKKRPRREPLGRATRREPLGRAKGANGEAA